MLYNNHGNYHIVSCAAPYPKELRYTPEQEKIFKTPKEHELIFAKSFKHSPNHSYLSPTHPITDDISSDYTRHFGIFLQQINNVASKKSNIPQFIFCDIVAVTLWMAKPTSISLAIINIRPCAQGLGISKLIFYQLIKICFELQKDFVVDGPIEETRDILHSLFDSTISNDKFRQYILDNTLGSDEFPISHIQNDHIFFNEFSNEKRENFYNSLYIIHFVTIREWMTNSPISLEERCRVEAMVNIKSSRESTIAVINEDYFPSADDLNSQEKVDERFALKQAKQRQHKSKRKRDSDVEKDLANPALRLLQKEDA